MGANLLIVVAIAALQSPQQDTTTSFTHGFAFERLQDLFQYNRVQGLSLGLGYRLSLPGIRSTAVYATARYGLSDERITGRLTLRHDTPASSFAVSGYADIADLDPFSPGRTLANAANGLFAGHDNADYALVRGGSTSLERWLAPGLDLLVAARVERHISIEQVAQSELNDLLGGTGLFPPNPPVDEGTFGGGSVRLRHLGATRWSLTADVLAGSGGTTGRLFGEARRAFGDGLGATLRLKAGAATEPAQPQMLFRLGGLHTVRGFEYGTLRAASFWAAQVDLSPFGGRVRPVAFLDLGQAAGLPDLFSSSALVGGGVGLSLFGGLIRFDLSRPISPDLPGKVRFDLVLQGVR